MKIFISYSHDSEEHKEWVKDLALKLKEKKHKVILDQFDLKPGGNISYFMEKSFKSADVVFILMTPNYKKKAERREGGVGKEYSVISYEIYEKNIKDDLKYIPILIGDNFEECTPFYLRDFYCYQLFVDLNYKNCFENLLQGLEIQNTNEIETSDIDSFEKSKAPRITVKKINEITKGINYCEFLEQSILMFGYPEIDHLTAGFRKKTVTFIGSRKQNPISFLQASIIKFVSEYKIPVLIIANNLTMEEILQRFIQNFTQSSLKKIIFYRSQDEFLSNLIETLEAFPIHIIENIYYYDLKKNIINSIKDNGIQVVYILDDFRKLIPDKKIKEKGKYENLNNKLMAYFKKIAIELEIAIVVESEVKINKNRDYYWDGFDVLINAGITNHKDIDIIIDLGEEEYQEIDMFPKLDFRVLKNGFGECGALKLIYHDNTFSYYTENEYSLKYKNKDIYDGSFVTFKSKISEEGNDLKFGNDIEYPF